MVESDDASEVIAKYAAAPRAELDRTLPLVGGEELVVAVRAATRYSGDTLLGRLNTARGGRRSFVRLSTTRLCVLRRYSFIRDRILVIPPNAITELDERGPTESVRIHFRYGFSERVLTIATWTQSKTPIDRRALQSAEFAETFRELALVLGATGA